MPSIEPPAQGSMQRIPAGTRLNGIYEVERLVAVGGMGEVYRATAIQTGDPVAIKTVRPDLAENETALALFRKEAAALHNLQHEAIVRYYVFTIDPDLGCPYLAMEFVDGQTLSDCLRLRPLNFEAVQVLQQRIAAGLHAAHELGIIHRDVSPDNIILPGGNVARAKIIDFGIARTTLVGETTVIGSGFAGKYNYVSPEQLGLFGGEVTPKSDIYSFGLVLAGAISSRPLAMGGSQAEILDKRRRLPDLSTIDERMRPLLERMLQPRPADRPASMTEVATWRPAAPAAAARPAPIILGAATGAVALTVVAILVGSLLADRVPEPPNPSGQSPPNLSPPGNTSPEPLDPTVHPVPPAPPPPSPDPPNRAETVRHYIDQYNGGDCFLLRPMLVSSDTASIEAFGTSRVPFEVFNADFRQRWGFEAQISLRLVTNTQCPAVEFLKRVDNFKEPAPRLQIVSYNLRGSQPLIGRVEGLGDRHVALLLVSDDGYVDVLPPEATKRSGAILTFTQGLRKGRHTSKAILIAIASSQPLAAVAARKSVPTGDLFTKLFDEVTRTRQTLGIDAAYFIFEG
ncbi:serine/threonine-protein kinase [Microvirga massiliensis]|uniref:serine/threonine-protein kinase n=1 Tax=Microvirga massiliensis TaxID=1033741 RepID=UPI00062B5DD4|nr:serine/threonine-protein kinase [Microvirga massiliensis]